MKVEIEKSIKHVFLKDISRIIMGQSPSSEYYNVDEVEKLLAQGNADIKNRLTVPKVYSVKGNKECESEDIIMSVRAPVGTVAKADGNYFIGRGVCSIKSEISEYLYQYLLWHEPKW